MQIKSNFIPKKQKHGNGLKTVYRRFEQFGVFYRQGVENELKIA